MNELHASETVAARVREWRLKRHWSMRELADRSGLPEDVIEAIENGRRRRGVTVDELMTLAHALSWPAAILLPADRDYYTAEEERRAIALDREREESVSRTSKSLGNIVGMGQVIKSLAEKLDKVPDGAVIAVERDGKLVAVEEAAGLLDGDLGLGGADVPLDHGDVRPSA